MRLALILLCVAALSLAGTASAQQSGFPPGYFSWAGATDAAGHPLGAEQAAANSGLTTFSYTVTSSRDGKAYSGRMVGKDPFGSDLSTAKIKTVIIPVKLITNSIAVKISNGSVFNTKHGVLVFDPTAADAALTAPNNVPLTLMEQSPIFQGVPFQFGGTDVSGSSGATQYIDAFQRGNFWQLVGGSGYHTLLSPVEVRPVIELNLPADQGLAAAGPSGPVAIVDFDTMERQIFNKLLATAGVDPSEFPIFLFYNTVMGGTSSGVLKHCCALGFHAAVTQNPGAHVQTYAFIDFDTSGAFGPSVSDTSVAAHEVGEWMDDPFGNNPTPAWGHTGQVGACQGNLEVGDPLSGTNMPNVTGANGFVYHLQELAFFSWFYGKPSIGVNGWFSNNNTFKSDAGAVCTK